MNSDLSHDTHQPSKLQPLDFESMFERTLNFQTLEDLWPGDAADLLFPELFVLDAESGAYILNSKVHEHMRCEQLRRCWWAFTSLEHQWVSEVVFDPSYTGTSFDALWFGEDDPDTLNSELLLTQEYEPPRSL